MPKLWNNICKTEGNKKQRSTFTRSSITLPKLRDHNKRWNKRRHVVQNIKLAYLPAECWWIIGCLPACFPFCRWWVGYVGVLFLLPRHDGATLWHGCVLFSNRACGSLCAYIVCNSSDKTIEMKVFCSTCLYDVERYERVSLDDEIVIPWMVLGLPEGEFPGSLWECIFQFDERWYWSEDDTSH